MKKWFLLCILFLLTSCDYKELNEISISTVLGIDKKDNQYIISSLIVGKEENETILQNGTGTSLTTAFANLNLNLSENLYLNHVQTIIISDDLAKEGLEPILNYFIKNDSIQNNFYLFLAHNVSSKQILETLLESNNSDYNTITNIFKYNDEIEFSDKTDTLTELVDTLLEKGKEPTLNTVTISKERVIASNLAILKKDKLKAFSENMIGIAILSNHANHIVLNIACKENKSVVELGSIHVKTKTNGKKIDNYITGNISVKENTCGKTIKNEKQLLKKVEWELQKILKNSINESKQLNSDIFGYGALLSKKNKNLKTDYFTDLIIENHMNFKIKDKEGDVYHE